LRRDGFGLVRIFTQSRRVAEIFFRVSEGVLRDGSILWRTFACKSAGLLRVGILQHSVFFVSSPKLSSEGLDGLDLCDQRAALGGEGKEQGGDVFIVAAAG
jgi:hypothetical protein